MTGSSVEATGSSASKHFFFFPSASLLVQSPSSTSSSLVPDGPYPAHSLTSVHPYATMASLQQAYPTTTASATTMPAQGASEGRLQETVRSIGSLAKDPKLAYSLSALFALATPFGFASPQQAAAEAAAQLQQQQMAAQALQAATSRGSSSLAARLVANAQAQRARRATAAAMRRALPPFWQLAGFAALFATGGYMIDQGDSLNGSGVVTAWSTTYLLFRTLPTLAMLPRHPLALALSTGVVTLGLGVHGCHYFDAASWRGAVPGLGFPATAPAPAPTHTPTSGSALESAPAPIPSSTPATDATRPAVLIHEAPFPPPAAQSWTGWAKQKLWGSGAATAPSNSNNDTTHLPRAPAA
ncbi:hypothetical protein ACQY0O_006966 [Thecaphora frezii]